MCEASLLMEHPADVGRAREADPMLLAQANGKDWWDRFIDVLPILTLVLGYLGSQWDGTRRAKREREDGRVEAEAAFQRATILELQDVTSLYVQSLIEWSYSADSTSTQIDASWHRLYQLNVRVRDSALRTIVSALLNVSSSAALGKIKNAGEVNGAATFGTEVGAAVSKIHARVGELLLLGPEELAAPPVKPAM